MSKYAGAIFAVIGIVFLVAILWGRRDDTAVVMVEPELVEEVPAEVTAATVEPTPVAGVATPAAGAPAAGTPVAAAPAPEPAPAPAVATAAAPPATPAAAVTANVTPAAQAIRGPGLGVAATPEQIAAANISIPPDGRNLPPGSGTAAQGALVYIENCVGCHGPQGAGGDGMVTLTGGVGSLATGRPVKTVNSFWPYATTLFDYIRRAMPLNAPQSLTDDQVYAVTAFILAVDDILPIGTVLDATTLPTIEMPNRNGFVNWWPTPANAQLTTPAPG